MSVKRASALVALAIIAILAIARPRADFYGSNTLPGTCTLGDVTVTHAGTPGLYYCNATNTWTQITGNGAVTQIGHVVTSGSQSTVTFSSIPGTYNKIEIAWVGQDTQSGTSESTMYCQMNGDNTSGNYTSSAYNGAQSGSPTAIAGTIAATSNGVPCGVLPQSGTSGAASGGTISIEGYAGTIFNKEIRGDTGNHTTTLAGTIIKTSGQWKSAAAITQIVLTAGGTAFTNGSVFTAYGFN